MYFVPNRSFAKHSKSILKLIFIWFYISISFKGICQDINGKEQQTVYTASLSGNCPNGFLHSGGFIYYSFYYNSTTKTLHFKLRLDPNFFTAGQSATGAGFNTTGALMYRYYGKTYDIYEIQTVDKRGLEGVSDVKITDLYFKFSIPAFGGKKFQANSNGIEKVLVDRAISPEEAKKLNLDYLKIIPAEVDLIKFTNTQVIEERIKNFTAYLSKQKNYKDLIKEADQAFQNNNLGLAETRYKQALNVFPEENHPKQRLEKIEELKEKKDKQTKYKDYIAAGDQAFNNSNWDEAKENYEKAAETYPNEPYPKNQLEKVKAKKQLASQSGTKKDELAGSNGSTKTNPGNTKTGNTAGNTTKNTNSSGNNPSTPKTTSNSDAWTQQQTDDYLAKNAEKRRLQEEKIEKETAALANSLRGAVESYYAAQNTEKAKQNLRSNSTLSGNYNSLEEIEAEFNQKYNTINSDVEQLRQAQNQELMTNYNNMNTAYSGNSKMQAAGAVVTGVAYLVNESAAEREKKEAEERLEKQKREAEAKLLSKKITMRLTLRQTVLAEFSDGGVPLSSHKVEVKELYFFAYIFDEKTIHINTPVIQLSNVFPVAKYSDGSWPFKTSLVNEISKSSQGGKTTLVGYYTTKELAEQNYASFKRMAEKSEFVIENFNYKGKPSKAGAGAETDFWGNSSNGNTPKHETNAPKNNVQYDEWGNPLKGSKPAPTSNTKSTVPKKPVKYDEWGNPVKE